MILLFSDDIDINHMLLYWHYKVKEILLLAIYCEAECPPVIKLIFLLLRVNSFMHNM